MLFQIPLIQKAEKIRGEKIKLIATPWSPPKWMKTNHDFHGKGTIKGKPKDIYYTTWANYIVKFFEEYKKNGIEFWGLTIQNEPFDGRIPNFTFNCNAMTPDIQRDFITETLGPKLNSSGYGPNILKLMILDDQRSFIKTWADIILTDEKAKQYVSGIAFHWYLNKYSGPHVLEYANEKYPEYFLLSTEACEGTDLFEVNKVLMGSWQRAENYAYDIIVVKFKKVQCSKC